MNVLFVFDRHVGLGGGGIYQQITQTQKGLEKHGVRVHAFDSRWADLKNIDICHVFGTGSASCRVIKYCRENKIPVVMSAVSRKFYADDFKTKLKFLMSRFLSGFLREVRSFNDIAELVDFFFVLNFEEKKLLTQHFHKIDPAKVHLIPNGIDDDTISNLVINKRKHLVLNVAKICEANNQYRLIQAAKDANWELALVGALPAGIYTYKCLELAKTLPNVHVYGELPCTSHELINLYGRAKVFCLPSMSGVQSLTLTEAAGHGCNIVVSKSVPTQNFPQDKSIEVNPESLCEIRAAIELAISQEGGNINRLETERTWDEVGEVIKSFYRRALVG